MSGRGAPEVNTPADLADLRLWLADQWRPGRPYADHAAYFHAQRSALNHNLVGAAAAYAHVERLVLENATLFWVSEDMVDLLLAAAGSVPDDVRLEDLPLHDPTGLIVFAKPWYGIDVDNPGHPVQVDAMSWGAARLPAVPARGRDHDGLALTISSYRHVDFADGLAQAELMFAAGTGAINHGEREPLTEDQVLAKLRSAGLPDDFGLNEAEYHHNADGNGAGSMVRDPDGQRSYNLTGRTWVPLGRVDWPVEDAIGTPPWSVDDGDLASMVEDRKVIAAFWTLIHQDGIAATVTEKAPRAAARRSERAGVAKGLSDVRVVRLRKVERTAPDDDGEGAPTREWSHRWIVSGHWRWQPYGEGRKLRRLTYVRPHVKGPADKPLHVPTTVNAWVR